MDDFDWKDLVGGVAPAIATALGGPVAGMAVREISSALLGTPDATEKQIEEALRNASPDDLYKLKKADQEFALKMEELGVDLEKIAAQDRDSARNMQKETKSYAVPIIAGLTVAGFFGVVSWVLTGAVALDSTILGFVLGQVSAKAEQVYNYYFGSSAGSKEKTKALKESKGIYG